jgi:ubiquinone/menaquinone biosynthesis C-methylase UbiE
MFEVAKAYEQRMGSWSKLLAPLFIEFVSVQGEVLDVGCGTGSLTFAAAENKRVTKIIGPDASTGFIEYARSRNVDARVSFEVGDAQNLPFPDASFDRCLSSLIVSFIPDAPKAVREMRRVTRPGGVVATCMWDNGGGMEGFHEIWNAAIALDSGAERYREKHLPFGSANELSSLWSSAGLRNIETRELVIPLEFGSFDDLWGPSVGGQGPMGAYLAGLPENNRETLKARLRQNLFGNRPDEPFTLQAKAWAVKGIVP